MTFSWKTRWALIENSESMRAGANWLEYSLGRLWVIFVPKFSAGVEWSVRLDCPNAQTDLGLRVFIKARSV